MKEMHRIPVFNRGPGVLEIGLEPEGDCLTLQPGESLEIRYEVEGPKEPTVELEMEGQLLSIHCMVAKEVWRDGRKVR